MSAAAFGEAPVPAFDDAVPEALRRVLGVASDPAWARAIAADLPTLLIDHANCELKAAASALSMLRRYQDRPELCWRMSRLAREELRHYEQVQRQMAALGIEMRALSAAAYAAGLRQAIGRDEPRRLVDTLIVGALIEARSCERFALVAPLLPARLATFYRGLLASEARHFEHYIALARDAGRDRCDVDVRIDALCEVERALIAEPAREMRFHSGPPADRAVALDR